MQISNDWWLCSHDCSEHVIMVLASREINQYMVYVPDLGRIKFQTVLYACHMYTEPQSTPFWTHWGRDKMYSNFLILFANVFSSMKIYRFPLRFHWNLLAGVQLTIFQHWIWWWFVAVQATGQYLNKWWLGHSAPMSKHRLESSLWFGHG